MPSQTKGSQRDDCSAGHVPFPLQLAASVATPAVHDAALQATSVPTKPEHVVTVCPSQIPSPHGSATVPAGHDGRPPRGAPTTGVHLPSAPGTSHASHCPWQMRSQHTPSVQKPLEHSAPPVHGCAALDFGRHSAPLQYAVGAQSASPVHVVLHAPPEQA